MLLFFCTTFHVQTFTSRICYVFPVCNANFISNTSSASHRSLNPFNISNQPTTHNLNSLASFYPFHSMKLIHTTDVLFLSLRKHWPHRTLPNIQSVERRKNLPPLFHSRSASFSNISPPRDTHKHTLGLMPLHTRVVFSSSLYPSHSLLIRFWRTTP